MQNKGAIRLLAIVLAIACAYQLSFTFVARNIEKKAANYALEFPLEQQVQMEQKYLDSVKTKKVFLGFTYKQVKEKELNLGLDLKGGMNVMLEISVEDVLMALSNNSQDPVFNEALAQARRESRSSNDDYITLFSRAYSQLSNNAPLAYIFNTQELRDKVKPTSTNDEVIAVLRAECDSAISNSYNVLRSRIDRFGVTNPNIQRIGNTGRILVELPGVKEPERVRKLLQGTASLEFWTTYDNEEFFTYLNQANGIVKELSQAAGELQGEKPGDEKPESGEQSLVDELEAQSSETVSEAEFKRQNPLFAKLQPSNTRDAVIGYAFSYDTAAVNTMLNLPQVRMALPRDVRFMWDVKATDEAESIFPLYAIKVSTRDGKAPLDGSAVADARATYSDRGSAAEVDMVMTPTGAKTWARLTADNVGKCIAIVLDGYVYSAPRVQTEITGGRSQITGNFTITDATDLANVLKSGKLPAPARITQEAVVGPSLGQESISSSMISFVLAFVLVLIYMILFYKKAGVVASIALIANLFFLFGVLVSFGAVLTLPGIAGIVLTMGMAVDANVIIYERIKEELRGGKGLGMAISAGYKNAMSAIIDSNVTSLLTGIVLFIFGTGPVQGFATTLIIGIITSLFTSIFITRLIFTGMLSRERKITFSRRWNESFLANTKVDFIKKGKIGYIISTILIIVSVVSLTTQGMNYGVDFTGGRNFVVRFDRPITDEQVRQAVEDVFSHESVEGDEAYKSATVTRFGAESQMQMRIVTQYMYDDASEDANTIVEHLIYDAVEPLFATRLTFDEFQSTAINPYGIISADMVGPSVASDITRNSFIAVIFSLLAIGLYILLRFKKWQWGVGSVVALMHDAFLTIGVFSLLYKVLPFNLEVNQSFIAAILTIIGYSINDKVVIFDRIREYGVLFPKRDIRSNINYAVNSTLSRTINTSGTTFVTLLAIFLFGGEVIRGFIFALMFGVLMGTFSSIFTATPASYQLIKRPKAKKSILVMAIISAVILLGAWLATPASFVYAVIIGALSFLALIFLLVAFYVITDKEKATLE